jgi:hypothetical protein
MEVLAMYRFFVFLLLLSVFFFASDVQFAYTSGDQKTGAQPAILSLLLSDAEAQSTCTDNVRSGYADCDGVDKVLLTVPAGKTFILTDAVGSAGSSELFSILENQTVKLKFYVRINTYTGGLESVNLKSGVPFAAGSQVVASCSGGWLLVSGYEI